MNLQPIKENWLIITIFVAAYIFLSHKPQKVEGHYTIGLIYAPGASYFHNRISSYLEELVKNDPQQKITLRPFPVPSFMDMVAISNIARTMLQTEPDVIVSVGAVCSQCTWSMARRKRYDIPQVAIGVDGMIERGMIESFEHPGGNVTGALAFDSEATNEADLILALRPQTKKVLIPYFNESSAVDSSEGRAREIQCRLAPHGIEVTLLPIDNIADTLTWVKMVIDGYDILLYFSTDAVVGCEAGLAKLGQRFGVAVLAESMGETLTNAFSFGDDHMIKTRVAYDQVKQILFEGKKPADIPVVRVYNGHKLIINVPAARRQGYTDINVQEILERLKAPQFEQIRDRIEVIE